MSSTRKPTVGWLSLLLVILPACHPTPTDPAEVYLQRLENVLDTSASSLKKQTLAFPAARELRLNQESSILSVREFLSLRQCALHNVIAQRNSLIGKVAVPSQLLFNDLQILNTGPACVAQLEQNKQSALAAKLSLFLEYKQSTIASQLWRAILGGSENAKLWSSASAPGNYPDALSYDAVQDIRALTQFTKQVLQGQYQLSRNKSNKIEQHLGNLRHGDAGHLLSALAGLSTTLELADAAVLARLEHPLCLQPQPTTQARYLKNVVSKFFAPRVQKHAVKLTQRYQQLLPAYLELENLLAPHATPAYQSWSQIRQTRFDRYLSATRSHVDLLQRLFRQCGLTAGNRTG